jgi:hypothetical protein
MVFCAVKVRFNKRIASGDVKLKIACILVKENTVPVFLHANANNILPKGCGISGKHSVTGSIDIGGLPPIWLFRLRPAAS